MNPEEEFSDFYDQIIKPSGAEATNPDARQIAKLAFHAGTLIGLIQNADIGTLEGLLSEAVNSSIIQTQTGATITP